MNRACICSTFPLKKDVVRIQQRLFSNASEINLSSKEFIENVREKFNITDINGWYSITKKVISFEIIRNLAGYPLLRRRATISTKTQFIAEWSNHKISSRIQIHSLEVPQNPSELLDKPSKSTRIYAMARTRAALLQKRRLVQDQRLGILTLYISNTKIGYFKQWWLRHPFCI